MLLDPPVNAFDAELWGLEGLLGSLQLFVGSTMIRPVVAQWHEEVICAQGFDSSEGG